MPFADSPTAPLLARGNVRPCDDLPVTMDFVFDLAFTLRSTPGAYVALLGAGVSKSAGVPSAWEVQVELIRQIATARGESVKGADDDLFAWYLKTFNETATYGAVLNRVAPTEYSRQSLLRSMFEPSEEERQQGEKVPTPAHTALADLVASGHLNVIVTTNFDLLMESALRARGVEPIVVAHRNHVEGLPPLHTIQALVVHLHGSYLEPTSMLNTDEELATYPEELDALLDRIFPDRALLIAGWSSTYDPALRSAIDRCTKNLYRSYWIDSRPLEGLALELASRHAIEHVVGDANESITGLRGAVAALNSRSNARHPLDVPVAVATAKRLLGLSAVPIELHDSLVRELDRVSRGLTSPQRKILTGEIPSSAARADLDDASAVAHALISTAAYWGNRETDLWWAPAITKYGGRDSAGYEVLTPDLRLQTASTLMFVAGTAAIAAGRTDTVVDIFARASAARRFLFDLHPVVVRDEASASQALADQLRSLFIDELTIGAERYTDAWEEFDFLFAVAAVLKDLREPVNFSRAQDLEESLPTYRTRARNAKGKENETSEQRLLDSKLAERSELMDYLSKSTYPGIHHIRVSAAERLPTTRPGVRLLAELESQRSAHPLVQAGLGEEWELRMAIETLHESFRNFVENDKWEPERGFRGMISWLDAPGVPVV